MVPRRIPLDVHSESCRTCVPSHVISLRGDIGWPPRSPDLNPCDFFLWGYVKSKVYEHRPSTLEHLKAAITEEINAIPHNMLERVMVNFRERLQNFKTTFTVAT